MKKRNFFSCINIEILCFLKILKTCNYFQIVSGRIINLKLLLKLVFSEVNAGFFYKTAAERERLVSAEREHIMKRVQKIVDLKKMVCDDAEKKDGKKRGFVVINQKVYFFYTALYFEKLDLFGISMN